MSISSEQVQYLIQHPELLAVTDGLELTKKSLLRDLAQVKKVIDDPELARAVMEVAVATRKAKAKLGFIGAGEGRGAGTGAGGQGEHRPIVSEEAVQQATPWPVALLRAHRLAGSFGTFAAQPIKGVRDVTCSIGTELAACAEVFGGSGSSPVSSPVSLKGTDIDAARIAMAQHNLADYPIHFGVADALAGDESNEDTVIVADPARRSSSGRIYDPEQLQPPLSALMAAWPEAPVAIKCAPGIDYSDFDGEAAVASVAGNVKETCLYSPSLALPGRGTTSTRARRSAWVMHEIQAHAQQRWVVEHYDDTLPCATETVETRSLGKYVIDPDGAVVRAGLVQQYAAAHGLWQLDSKIAHLTGDLIPVGASGFEILERTTIKNVRKSLAQRNCGSAEILVRGHDLDPDQLRKKWKLRGKNSLAVVLTRIDGAGVALICTPRQWGASFEVAEVAAEVATQKYATEVFLI